MMLNKLTEEDDLHELLFKYYNTIKGFQYNLDQFNQQLRAELKSEDELYSHLVAGKSIAEAQE